MYPDHPPPPYGSTYNNPRTPLVSRAIDTSKLSRAARRYSRLAFIRDAMFVVFAIFFVLQNIGIVSTLADDVPASQKAAMRRLWKREQKTHDNEVALWDRERAIHHDELAQWPKEREEEERRRQALRDAFDKERKQEERDRREARDNFDRKWEAEERRRQEKRVAFEKETEEWERQRKQAEQRRKDIERRRQGTHWSELVVNSRCYEYGTRAYEARLLDIPEELGWREICDDMPIEIHGRRIESPHDCHRNDNGDVWARWLVDFDEPQCVFYWDNMRDLGCTSGQTGTRRFESRLMNLRKGDDWDSMCSTTPATIQGTHFEHPTACEDRDGRTGVWHVPDDQCDYD